MFSKTVVVRSFFRRAGIDLREKMNTGSRDLSVVRAECQHPIAIEASATKKLRKVRAKVRPTSDRPSVRPGEDNYRNRGVIPGAESAPLRRANTL